MERRPSVTERPTIIVENLDILKKVPLPPPNKPVAPKKRQRSPGFRITAAIRTEEAKRIKASSSFSAAISSFRIERSSITAPGLL